MSEALIECRNLTYAYTRGGQTLVVLNREMGKTIVMVTHDPQAAEYANSVVRLDKGALIGAAA